MKTIITSKVTKTAKIITLGTSSGVMTLKRACSSYIVQPNQSSDLILVDCGEGTQLQLQKAKISLFDIKTIVVTHLHGDHFYGIFGILKGMGFGAERKSKLTLIAPKALKKIIETVHYHPLNPLIEFKAIEDYKDEETITITRDFNISSIRLKHRVPSWGFIFESNKKSSKLNMERLELFKIPKGKAWGYIQARDLDGMKSLGYTDMTLDDIESFMIPKEKVKFAISGDNANPRLWKKVKNLSVLVHESTYTNKDLLKVGKKPQHSSAGLVAEFAEEYGLKTLILSHFSKRYTSMKAIGNEASKYYRGDLHLANDLDGFEI